MNTFHCPYRQSTLLQQALAPDKMRIAFLLGAGCPVSIRVNAPDGADKPLIPDVAGLTTHINTALGTDATHKAPYEALTKRLSGTGNAPNVEHILSHLRALHDVVRGGELGGLDQTALAALDERICGLTTELVSVELPADRTPYHQLAAWVGGVARTHAVEVFTPNYDLLVEQAFESHKIPYFDGFVGARQAFFDLASVESDVLPARWTRLWKLHGSVNWWRTSADEVVRKSEKGAGDRQMIYPSHLKYDQSRRLPYLAMLDRLRDFLGRGQAVVVTCGYSFADQHLNEVVLNGLRSNATAMCFALMHGPRANYQAALVQARKHPNLSLLALDGAVLGTSERDWRSDEQTSQPLHGLSVKGPPEAGTNCRFTLGDFKQFGAFLAQQLSSRDAATDTHAA
jgi:SIR2-like domain